MLSWPAHALDALVLLFRPLQDVDVFVEDEGSEAFYLELIQRISPRRVRVRRVFALNGRSAVVARALAYASSERPALFLIDGDFEWVRGEAPPTMSRLFRIPAYCIENFIVDEVALCRIVSEECCITEQQAADRLEYATWMNRIRDHLVELFVALAILNEVKPQSKTVGRGLALVFSSQPHETLVLDPDKCADSLERIKHEIMESIGREAAEARIANLAARVAMLPNPLHVVSGKDFLLPLSLIRVLQLSRTTIKRKTFRFRLMGRCGLSGLDALRQALDESLKRPS